MIRGRDPGEVAAHANGGLRPAAGRDVRGGMLASCAWRTCSSSIPRWIPARLFLDVPSLVVGGVPLIRKIHASSPHTGRPTALAYASSRPWPSAAIQSERTAAPRAISAIVFVPSEASRREGTVLPRYHAQNGSGVAHDFECYTRGLDVISPRPATPFTCSQTSESQSAHPSHVLRVSRISAPSTLQPTTPHNATRRGAMT